MDTILDKNFYTPEEKSSILQKISDYRGDLENISYDIASEQVLNWPVELNKSEDMKAIQAFIAEAIGALEKVGKFIEGHGENK